jgi:hypothetical protein
MPVQHFAQPAATTIDTDQPITEIRWDFGYDRVDILESGNVIAQIRNPNILLSSGIDITANNGDRFVIHIKKDVSAGPFAVFRNGTELVGGIPSWGVASSVAGKMVHLPNDLYQEKLAIRKNLERPIRVAQSWLGFSSLVAIVFAYLSGMGKDFVPKRFLSSVETPLFSGAIAALAFMALALVMQKRSIFFLLPFAQIFTIVQALFIGSTLLKSPKYPHFGGFRLFVCALTLWVLIDSWNTVRLHRGRVRETRKLNQLGLDEIEKTTVRDLAKVASERGHLLAWQQRSAELHSDSPHPDSPHHDSSQRVPDTRWNEHREANVPSALDLLADGADPFAPELASDQAVGPAAGGNVAKAGWFNRPATITLQRGAKGEEPVVQMSAPVAVLASAAVPTSPSFAPPPSALPTSAPFPLPTTSSVAPAVALAPSVPTTPGFATLKAPTFAAAGLTAPGLTAPTFAAAGLTASSVSTPQPTPVHPSIPVFHQQAPLQAPPTSHVSPSLQALPVPPIPPTPQVPEIAQIPEMAQPEAWVPPAAPLVEPVVSAKPGPTNHPLRSRVRSGL